MNFKALNGLQLEHVPKKCRRFFDEDMLLSIESGASSFAERALAASVHGLALYDGGCRWLALTASLLLGLLVSNAAMAQPKTINDCEKIQAADAYNQCLALFGPVAHERGSKVDPEVSGGKATGPEPKADASPASNEAPSQEGASSHHRGHHSTRHYRSVRHYSHHASRKRASFRVR